MFHSPQDVVCSLGCQGTLLTHIDPALNQHPHIPFCRDALQPLPSQFILVPSIILFQVQNLALSWCQWETHTWLNCCRKRVTVLDILNWNLDTLGRVSLTFNFGCLQCKSINLGWSLYTVFLINYISLSMIGDSSHLS